MKRVLIVFFLGSLGCGSSALQSSQDASAAVHVDTQLPDVTLEKPESADLAGAITDPTTLRMSVNQYVDSLCFDAEVCLQASPGQTCMFNAMTALLQGGPIVGLVKEHYDACMALVEVQRGNVSCDTFDVNNPPEACSQAFIHEWAVPE
jgi:hypothetical protein